MRGEGPVLERKIDFRRQIGYIELLPILHRWQSGQMHQTVNLAGYALRRFESFPVQFFLVKLFCD
jgi:hypothetical protein